MLIALLFLVVPFLPATGAITLGFVVAERVLYIPSIGFCILICLGFQRLYTAHLDLKLVWIICYVSLCVVFVLRTTHRSKEWMNEERLFKSAIRVCPNNAKVYYNLGRLSSYKHDTIDAFKYYHEAIRLCPQYDSALMNLGNLYRARNQLDLAEFYIQRSIQAT